MPDVRLIDANALKVRMFRSHEFNRDTGSFDLPVVPWHDVEDADTIDAVEVVHGRWLELSPFRTSTTLKCSVCLHWQPAYAHEPWKYCPNCGARMDAKEAEHGQES